jgi:hypothetical protein
MELKMYAPVWNKYRPAILKMMLDAAAEPQQYKLSAHEFKALNSRQKGGYNFTLEVANGKATNNIRQCLLAQDLLEVLQLSRKGSELIGEASYQFSLDKQFILHISRLN